MDSRTSQMIEIIKKKLKEAKKSGNSKNQTIAYRMFASIYEEEKDYRKCLKNLEEADKIAVKEGRNRMRVALLVTMGRISMEMKKDLDAMRFNHMALNICNEFGFEPMKPEVIAQIGLIYSDRKDYANATVNLATAIEMYRNMGKTSWEIHLVLIMKDIYHKCNQDADFTAQYGERLQVLQTKMEIIRLAQLDAREAAGYMSKGDSKKSFDLVWRALKSVEPLGDSNSYASLLSGIAINYDNLHDYPNAIKYLSEAIALCERIGDYKILPFSYANLALFHLRLGEVEEGKKLVKLVFDWCDEMGVPPDKMTEETLKEIFGR